VRLEARDPAERISDELKTERAASDYAGQCVNVRLGSALNSADPVDSRWPISSR